MMLGEPRRIQGDVRVEFRGTGRARFRLQHARDVGGFPDDLSWADVTQVSNQKLAAPEHAVGADGMVGVLVDVVDGDRDIVYRRYRAGWLRVVPLDEFDKDVVAQCKTYALKIVPLPAESWSA